MCPDSVEDGMTLHPSERWRTRRLKLSTFGSVCELADEKLKGKGGCWGGSVNVSVHQLNGLLCVHDICGRIELTKLTKLLS